MRLRALAHRLLEAAQKKSYGLHDNAKDFYGDRSTIDYWRTIQGTHVGFVGDPDAGAGIPIAGPESFLGGAGTANPLFKSMLEKYPKGTFIGDAVRKKNFPLTAAVFIEKFVGADDAEIKGKIDAAEKRITDFIGEVLVHSMTLESLILGNPKVKQFLDDGWSKKDLITLLIKSPSMFGIVSEQEVVATDSDGNHLVKWSSQQAKDYRNLESLRRDVARYFMRDDANKETSGLRMFETLFQAHTGTADADSTIISRLMSMEGVAGTSGEIDRYKIGSNYDIKNQMQKWPIPQIGLEYHHSNEMKESKLKELRAAIGDAYAHNQACLRLFGNSGKPIRVSRGFGKSIPFATNTESLSAQKRKSDPAKGSPEIDVSASVKVLSAAAKANAPVRFKSRPMCGFAESASVGSGFTGFSVSSEFPPEAFLSSFSGARFQGTSFEFEKESAIIGASSIQYSPKEFGIFQSVVLPWDKRRFVTAEEMNLLLEEVADEAKSKYADDNDVSPEWIDSYVKKNQSKALTDLNTVMFCHFIGVTPSDREHYDADTTDPICKPSGPNQWSVNPTYYRDTMAKLEAIIARAKAKRKESKS